LIHEGKKREAADPREYSKLVHPSDPCEKKLHRKTQITLKTMARNKMFAWSAQEDLVKRKE